LLIIYFVYYFTSRTDGTEDKNPDSVTNTVQLKY